MSVFYILIAIGLVALAFAAEFWLRRRRLADKPRPVGEELSNLADNIREQFQERFQSVRTQLWQPQANLAPQFRAWVTDAPVDPSLKAWLSSLSDEGMQALTMQISEFCTNLNLDLRWLVEHQLDKEPQFKAFMQDIVILYCTACWKAVQAQPTAVFLNLYESIVASHNDQYTQPLFAELVKRDMASNAPPEVLVAPKNQRQDYMLAAIRQAANDDWHKFSTVLKEVVQQNGHEGQPEPAPTNGQSA